MLFELVINLIHPIPYLEFEFDGRLLGQNIKYRFQTLMYALMFLKLYSFLRIIAAYTRYNNKMSDKYCEMYGGEADTAFALKAIQKDKPFYMLSFGLVGISVMLGILLRMFEILDTVNGSDYAFYTNGIWNVIVAMTTVGYGDFYAKTHVGRLILVAGIILGTLLVSLTIVALTGISSMNREEEKAFTILKRILIRKRYMDCIQIMFKTAFEMYKLGMKFTTKELFGNVHFMKLQRKLKGFAEKNVFLKRELSKDTFLRDEDKFIDLESQIDEELLSLKDSLKLLTHYKKLLKHQIGQQNELTGKLDKNIEVVKH